MKLCTTCCIDPFTSFHNKRERNKRMVKIVGGQVVREGEPVLAESGREGINNATAVLYENMTLCGSSYPKWQLLAAVALAALFMGIKGGFLVAAGIGGAYLYGQTEGSSSGGGGSGGMHRMNTRGGANIRGISDLPPPPKSS